MDLFGASCYFVRNLQKRKSRGQKQFSTRCNAEIFSLSWFSKSLYPELQLSPGIAQRERKILFMANVFFINAAFSYKAICAAQKGTWLNGYKLGNCMHHGSYPSNVTKAEWKNSIFSKLGSHVIVNSLLIHGIITISYRVFLFRVNAHRAFIWAGYGCIILQFMQGTK